MGWWTLWHVPCYWPSLWIKNLKLLSLYFWKLTNFGRNSILSITSIELLGHFCCINSLNLLAWDIGYSFINFYLLQFHLSKFYTFQGTELSLPLLKIKMTVIIGEADQVRKEKKSPNHCQLILKCLL